MKLKEPLMGIRLCYAHIVLHLSLFTSTFFIDYKYTPSIEGFNLTEVEKNNITLEN